MSANTRGITPDVAMASHPGALAQPMMMPKKLQKSSAEVTVTREAMDAMLAASKLRAPAPLLALDLALFTAASPSCAYTQKRMDGYGHGHCSVENRAANVKHWGITCTVSLERVCDLANRTAP